jgi:hypothetical protein
MAYVYRHVRLDNNEVFYIGIGSDSKGKYTRANAKNNRNIHWTRVVSLTDIRVDIISDGWVTWKEACEMEKFWIGYYGRRDLGTGSLVNLTEGGDDAPILLGERNGMYGKGYKLVGEKNGMYNKTHTEEARKAMSDSRAGKPNPHVQGDKNPSKREEVREKIRESKKRFISPMRRPEVVEKFKEAHRLKRESGYVRKYESYRECPHCCKSGYGPNMSRYHFDNCKNKK